MSFDEPATPRADRFVGIESHRQGEIREPHAGGVRSLDPQPPDQSRMWARPLTRHSRMKVVIAGCWHPLASLPSASS